MELRFNTLTKDQKNIMMMFMTVCILINTAIYYSIPECKGCVLRLKSGETVTGNCTELGGIMTSERGRTIHTLDEFELEVDNRMAEYYILNYTTTTSTVTTMTCPTTTTTQEKICPECKPIECKCDICTKCPNCDFKLSEEQIKWLLNDCREKKGSSAAYQAGEADACDRVASYLEVPGRPKFKSRPPTGVSDFYRDSRKTDEDLYCFKNLGDYFILNRTPDQNNRTRWGWNDDNCKKSALRINDL